MKWYMALNESGTRGDIAFHTKVAVLSATKNTSLQPVMMYTGARNDFTRWLEDHGVKIVDTNLPYLDLIEKLSLEGRYTTATVGHWLRTNISIEEKDEEFVLYTDVDVMFRSDPSVRDVRPKFFSAAPEFKPDGWNYCNAGVMMVNLPGLRSEYPQFEQFLKQNISNKTYDFHDQIAYNEFYQNRWGRLSAKLNWKPYWGVEQDAEIVHFHGPKIFSIEAMADRSWGWESAHERQLGSLFVMNKASYAHYVREITIQCPGLRDDELYKMAEIAEKIDRFEPDELLAHVNLDFMDFRMFPE